MYKRMSLVERRMFESIADAFIRELKQSSLNKVFSKRTAEMCMASMCNGLTGKIIENVLNTDIDILEGEICLDYRWEYSDRFHYHDGRYFGKEVVTKQLLSNNHDERLILSYELKILTLLTHHPSIIKPIGFTEIHNKPVAVYETVPSSSLAEFRGFKVNHLKWVLRHLMSAMEFIHSKSIILNFLTEHSVNRVKFDEFSIPVIVDFSWACHKNGVQVLPKYFREKSAQTNHLPSKVIEGKRPPSFSSDIYSFGILITSIMKRIWVHTPADHKTEIEHLSFKLLSNKRDYFPTELKQFVK